MNKNEKKAIQESFELLEASQKEEFPYYAECLGKKFIVLENVFSPKHHPDCILAVENLPFRAGTDFLDIGSGTGVIAVMAALGKAGKVVATDINPCAVKNIQENITLHNLHHCMEARKGSLFSPIEKNEKFDLIFWNIPFLMADIEVSMFQRSINDPGFRAVKQYFIESSQYIKKGGRIMSGFSTTFMKFEHINKIASDANIELKFFYRGRVGSYSESYNFEILELQHKGRL